ncbi:MAG TPA: PAS domain-containing sensor histidine kinase [Cyanobacteria bacterium UBA11372]|nr:PAS domain-containing sensor histidine kinase [Cyanobacteria bacterium UBA11372]
MATQTAKISTSSRKELQAKQNRFFTLSLDMFFILGFDGYLKQVNPMCEKILALTSAELLAQPLLELVHPEDRESTVAQLEKLATSTETVTFENRCRCQDGSYKWLLWNAAPCQDDKLIYAAARDITERKQAEEALKESEERFRLLIDRVKDYAIYMLDPDGRVVSWNQGAERINGYRTEEAIGKHVSCFHPPAEVESGRPEEVLQIAAQLGGYEYESLRLRKDESQFWANVDVTALRDENGQLRGYATVTRDITERKQASEALEQAYRELEKRVEERTFELKAANEMLVQEIGDRKRTEVALRQSKARLKEQAKQLEEALYQLHRTQAQLIQTEKMSSLGQLVAGVAHEINNPVSFIYGNLDHASHYIRDLLHLLSLYRRHYSNPPIEIQNSAEAMDIDFVMEDMPKLLSSMKMGADRIRQIVLSLRNFARHDESEMKRVDIHEGLDSTLKLLQHRLKGSDGQAGIQVIQGYGDLPLVECYPGLLNQVFMNLLSNAIDALENHPDPRILTIRTELAMRDLAINYGDSILSTDQSLIPNPYIIIRIADNGPGMTEAVCRRLFDPFFTTKPLGKNKGLGLSISYQIVVEKHGGGLHCVSSPGEGTEFIIEIPVQQTVQWRAFDNPLPENSTFFSPSAFRPGIF